MTTKYCVFTRAQKQENGKKDRSTIHKVNPIMPSEIINNINIYNNINIMPRALFCGCMMESSHIIRMQGQMIKRGGNSANLPLQSEYQKLSQNSCGYQKLR